MLVYLRAPVNGQQYVQHGPYLLLVGRQYAVDVPLPVAIEIRRKYPGAVCRKFSDMPVEIDDHPHENGVFSGRIEHDMCPDFAQSIVEQLLPNCKLTKTEARVLKAFLDGKCTAAIALEYKKPQLAVRKAKSRAFKKLRDYATVHDIQVHDDSKHLLRYFAAPKQKKQKSRKRTGGGYKHVDLRLYDYNTRYEALLVYERYKRGESLSTEQSKLVSLGRSVYKQKRDAEILELLSAGFAKREISRFFSQNPT